MNIRLMLVQRYCPAFVEAMALQALADATADAFGCRTPRLRGRPYQERLEAYARFTAERGALALRSGDDLSPLTARLRHNAFELGQRLRRGLRIRCAADAATAARLLYGIIGIDFAADAEGHVVIRGCSFSRFYSADVCRLAAALDEGLLTGLAGGGRFSFTQRMTEGGPCCRAVWEPPAGGGRHTVDSAAIARPPRGS
jgi:hypothetical protein